MGLRIFLRDWNEIAAKTEIGIVSEFFCEVEWICGWDRIWNCLRIFLWGGNEIAAKKEFGIVSEYFCEVGMNLQLRQNLELSQNIFVRWEWICG